MIMRFRGGGVGHTSTRAATDIFKNDRDILDMKSHQARKEQYAPAPLNVEEEEVNEDHDDNMEAEDSELEAGEGHEVDEEDELSESELVDYGYESEGKSEWEEEEWENRDVGEEDNSTIDELGALGYAEY
jgi:hypothetical protein